MYREYCVPSGWDKNMQMNVKGIVLQIMYCLQVAVICIQQQILTNMAIKFRGD
jgi:hypothetical protein